VRNGEGKYLGTLEIARGVIEMRNLWNEKKNLFRGARRLIW